MLELRTSCENCKRALPNGDSQAMICTFECTFCLDCVENILHNVCPNCGGGFEKRPSRPLSLLGRYPAKNDPVYKPVDMKAFQKYLEMYRKIDPSKR